MSENIGHRDALHLLACHLERRTRRNLAPTRSSSLRSTITTATFAALQNLCCTEASPRPERTATMYRILVK